MGHAHHHANDYNRAFAIGVALNVAFVAVEVAYGLLADSLALLADAGHNLSDVFALLIAWGATYLAGKAATDRRTYGLKRSTILASLISTSMLLVALGAIGWEALQRFMTPAPINGTTVIIVAAVGVLINGATAALFMAGRKSDLNIRAAFQHMAADAGISLGVAVAGVLILTTGWLWLDPAMSLLIAAVIFIGTWSLLRDSLNLAMDAVPPGVDLPGVRDCLLGQDWVIDIHDLHIWALSTTETALTVHVVTHDEQVDNYRLIALQQLLHDDFHIEHATIQVEHWDEETNCMLNQNACR
ncbi:cation transporter [Proteobacteria bacterium 005FR1]|nr:cation transporter [Proteobacteria bacterium 005FR1]